MKYKNHSKRIQAKLADALPQAISSVLFNGEIVVIVDNYSPLLDFVKKYNKKSRTCWINVVFSVGCHAVKLVPQMTRLTDDNYIIMLNTDPYINY